MRLFLHIRNTSTHKLRENKVLVSPTNKETAQGHGGGGEGVEYDQDAFGHVQSLGPATEFLKKPPCVNMTAGYRKSSASWLLKLVASKQNGQTGVSELHWPLELKLKTLSQICI